MAHRHVGRMLLSHGGRPVLRENCVTDNDNLILDVHDLNLSEPTRLEAEVNNIPGVVTVGLFALRPADVLLLGTAEGVRTETVSGIGSP